MCISLIITACAECTWGSAQKLLQGDDDDGDDDDGNDDDDDGDDDKDYVGDGNVITSDLAYSSH